MSGAGKIAFRSRATERDLIPLCEPAFAGRQAERRNPVNTKPDLGITSPD